MTPDVYSRDKRYSQHMTLKKPYKPVFQIGIDLFLALLLGMLWAFAFFLQTEGVLDHEFVIKLLNYKNSIVVALYFLKFVLDLVVYRILNKGNTKRITIMIYLFRLIYDCMVLFPALFYLYFVDEMDVGLLVNYSLPVVVSEILLYVWAVMEA